MAERGDRGDGGPDILEGGARRARPATAGVGTVVAVVTGSPGLGLLLSHDAVVGLENSRGVHRGCGGRWIDVYVRVDNGC